MNLAWDEADVGANKPALQSFEVLADGAWDNLKVFAKKLMLSLST